MHSRFRSLIQRDNQAEFRIYYSRVSIRDPRSVRICVVAFAKGAHASIGTFAEGLGSQRRLTARVVVVRKRFATDCTGWNALRLSKCDVRVHYTPKGEQWGTDGIE